MGNWTRFMDMHSGGGLKESPFKYIYIEAPEDEAKVIFYNRFGHSPERISCTCCGEDYSIHPEESLQQATAYERRCAYDSKSKKYIEKPDKDYIGEYITFEQYLTKADILIIYSSSISEAERKGEVPEQGYVWKD